MGEEGEWEAEAENWLRWARTPLHDAYWYYRDAFFDHVVPPPGRRTLEIGCGEGRVARDLVARGHRVVAVDPSRTLLRAARSEMPTGIYALADGTDAPFADESFDLAVAYNSLQVVDDMEGMVRETARILGSGGHFCICVNHPITGLGRFGGDQPNASFTLRRAYFDRERIEDAVERDGLTMTFRDWTYSLEDYSAALENAGFRIEVLREPRPISAPPRYQRWLQLPMFLNLRAVKA